MGIARHATGFCRLWGTGKTSWESKIFTLPAFTFHSSESSEELPSTLWVLGASGKSLGLRDGCSSPRREGTELLPQEDLCLESPSAWSHAAVELSTALLGSSVVLVVLSRASTIPELGPWSAATISAFEQEPEGSTHSTMAKVELASLKHLCSILQFRALQSISDVSWQSPTTPLCILVVQHSKERCETGRDFKKVLSRAWEKNLNLIIPFASRLCCLYTEIKTKTQPHAPFLLGIHRHMQRHILCFTANKEKFC